ncbi:uncharacterized protein At2g39920 [Punica granatum]|uniref:Uncharacterized protein At2g39920 n=2 Tax=Punica granatum TaxID=22663 RepID=A0A6P8CAJ6_PUNGR|nr:uncharacterized protein At2g39920 [Punica granatum]XP_031379960.1 uncharacterized protein At2g39920 [Punica granatum]PKI39610.1 hypothetical protein CRG98_040080 [Punica granatum]
MSAYAHQMEREFSARSLPSRGNSEVASSIGSTEFGFYMTSFAATVFIAALVTTGILLVTLLIALTVMLQSCESKNAGIIEIKRFSNNNRDVCRIFDLHAELNGLHEIEYPSTCHDLAVSYVRGGQYERDLSISIAIAEDYFSEIRPLGNGLDLILIDIDDILSSSSHQRSERDAFIHYIDKANRLRNHSVLKLYLKLQATRWSLGLLTRNLEQNKDIVTNQLVSAGFKNWSSLIMRFDNETQMDSREYFHRKREVLHDTGYRIKGTISSQLDALTGPGSGERVFKIPNPMHQSLFYPFDGARTE